MMQATDFSIEWRPDPANPDGPSVEFVTFDGAISKADFEALLAAYDPASGTSPTTAVCRPVVRALLDAAIAAGLALSPPV